MRTTVRAGVLLATLLLSACASVSSLPSSASALGASPAQVPATPAAPSEAPASSASPGPTATTRTVAQLTVPTFATVTADRLVMRQGPGLAADIVMDSSFCIDHQGPCEQPFLVGAERGYVWIYLLDGPIVADSRCCIASPIGS